MNICAEEGCERAVRARGLCHMHYQRWDRAQDPERFREYNRAHRQRHPERVKRQRREQYAADPARGVRHARRSYVKKQYGLTLEEYEAILARGCSICGRHGPRMALDHDHRNGQIRDALCVSCNNGIGRFHDDPTLLRAAAEYLETHEEKA